MKSLAVAPRHQQSQIVVTGRLAVALMAGRAVGGDIISRADRSVRIVHEAVLPGGTIFEDTHAVKGAFTTPCRARTISISRAREKTSPATRPIFRVPSHPHWPLPMATAVSGSRPSLAEVQARPIRRRSASSSPRRPGSRALPTTEPSRHRSRYTSYPALEVGLIGVPSDRDSFTTGRRLRQRRLSRQRSSILIRARRPGPASSSACVRSKGQLILSPGHFRNFADVGLIGANNSTVDCSNHSKTGDAFNPRFSLDSVSTDVTLGTLQPGDTVSYSTSSPPGHHARR